MDLLSAVHTSLALREFIEKDIISHLVSIELNAAASALSGIDKAVDKRSVYWSAINHLEVVEQALVSKLDSSNRFEAAKKYVYISALKAAIYKYLGEDGLVQKCCDDSVKVVKTHNYNEENHQFANIVKSWNPFGWIELRRYLTSTLGKVASSFDANKFWKELANRNEYFDLIQISTDPNENPYG
jgi:hypothetical protein